MMIHHHHRIKRGEEAVEAVEAIQSLSRRRTIVDCRLILFIVRGEEFLREDLFVFRGGNKYGRFYVRTMSFFLFVTQND